MTIVRILMLGDVAASVGVEGLRRLLPKLVAKRQIDFVVANGENASGGVGLTPEVADEILDAGVDCITTGNHVWRYAEIKPYVTKERRILRPANFGSAQPGRGIGRFETAAGVAIGVVNLAGRVFMDPADNPFVAADAALAELAGIKLVLVDIHAEASSEKKALGFYLAGRATAVVGTHTHVQTADEQLLDPGTAYITDLGMTGPHDSVIGMRKELILDRFVTGLPQQFKPAKNGVRLQGLYLEADNTTGRASAVERIDIPFG